jgi:hypothetical protein
VDVNSIHTHDVKSCPPDPEKVLDLLLAGVCCKVHLVIVSPVCAPSENEHEQDTVQSFSSSTNDGNDGWTESQVKARKVVVNMLVLSLKNTHTLPTDAPLVSSSCLLVVHLAVELELDNRRVSYPRTRKGTTVD